MKTNALKENQTGDIPTLPLQSFHHLLYDSLMPWLPEHQDILFYRLILSDLIKHPKNSFFGNLLTIFKKRNIAVSSGLIEEWNLFASITLNARSVRLHQSMKHLKVSNSKIMFYRLLVFESVLYSLNHLEQIIEKASETMKLYHVNHWMHIVHDLRHRARDRFEQETTPDDAAILFFTDTGLRMTESEIQILYPDYCRPETLLDSLNNMITDYASLKQNRKAVEQTEQWFEMVYYPGFIQSRKPQAESLSPKPDIKPPGRDRKKSYPEEPGVSGIKANEPDEQEVIGTREARTLLGIGRTKLYAMCEQNELPHFRIGKLIKFYRKELLEYKKEKG
ncbi:MAG: helix-turn-helix domain-containing protein [Bacteroidales bacterium]|nr:helix-turn-helix domain-containing protein [Bacteroidales bacterium]